MRRRLFSLEEARQTLPWLETKFHEMDPIIEKLSKTEEHSELLKRKTRGNGHHNIDTEMAEIRREEEELRSQAAKVVEEINDRGIIVRDIRMGLVDFPSMSGQREIFLCWVRGEKSIDWWHGTNEGYSSRKPL
ncbi:MAG: DUF2203 family protein [SAR202 cluster bacterium]|nr:DUF2203 family protein [SAR202 cluster bacterium]